MKLKALIIFALLPLTTAVGTTAFTASGDEIAGGPNMADHAPPSVGSIAPGTVTTMQNWQNYRQFMPDGMAAMFEGKYF